jgi:hypothetical protein
MEKGTKEVLVQFGKAIASTVLSVGLSVILRRYVKIPVVPRLK